MKDNFWTHNTDKVLLYTLVLLAGYIVIHVVHHEPDNMQAFTWASGAFSTVLGALILILTGRGPRADGQTANGLPHTPEAPPLNTSPTPFLSGLAQGSPSPDPAPKS